MSYNVDISYNDAQREIMLKRQSEFFHQKIDVFDSVKVLKEREKLGGVSYRIGLRQNCVETLFKLRIVTKSDFHGFFLSVYYLDVILGIEENNLPSLIREAIKKDGNDHLMVILLAVIFRTGSSISCDHNDGFPAILTALKHYNEDEVHIWKLMEVDFYKAIQWKLLIPTIVDFIYADRNWNLKDKTESKLFMTAVAIAIKAVHIIDITSTYFPSLLASACILVADSKLKKKKVDEISITHVDCTEDGHIKRCIGDVLWINTEAPITNILRNFLKREVKMFSRTRLSNGTNESNRCVIKKAPIIILRRKPISKLNEMNTDVVKMARKRDNNGNMYFTNKKGRLQI